MDYKIICDDCIFALPNIVKQHGIIDCIFADPPDNLGLNYDTYEDTKSYNQYCILLKEWTTAFIKSAKTTWISFNSKWTAEMGIVAEFIKNNYDIEFRPMIQTFTFGQHNKHDFTNAYRPLYRFRWLDAPIYIENIKIESWRMQHGDKRANPDGKSPNDVFDFPRVVGNSKQRRKWMPTQLHEGLVERCIKSCTKGGDLVADLFGGSGTALRVCTNINRNCIHVDVSYNYCEHVANEQNFTKQMQGLKHVWVKTT